MNERARPGEAFQVGQAVRAMVSVRGCVVVMGMGKSGHIGRKMASAGSAVLFLLAAALTERHRITSVLVVTPDECLCGAIDSNDPMRASVI